MLHLRHLDIDAVKKRLYCSPDLWVQTCDHHCKVVFQIDMPCSWGASESIAILLSVSKFLKYPLEQEQVFQPCLVIAMVLASLRQLRPSNQNPDSTGAPACSSRHGSARQMGDPAGHPVTWQTAGHTVTWGHGPRFALTAPAGRTAECSQSLDSRCFQARRHQSCIQSPKP
jgi:hypothetical protein